MASPVDTSVKRFCEDFPGAPVLSGAIGTLIGVLDACLVNGFGLRTATSLVVSGGVATITLPSDAKNVNLKYSVVLVEGATGALTALNGEQRVTLCSDTEIKFATAAADGTASGTITVKTAPAGWEKAFAGTNKAAYRSLNANSLGAYLWVNDATTGSANVRTYESMTGIDTGTGIAPLTTDLAGGGFWTKSSAANAVANRWDLIGDSLAFYFMPMAYTNTTASSIGHPTYFFGEFVAFKPADAFATALSFATSAPGNSANMGSIFGVQAAVAGRFARSYTGLGSAASIYVMGASGASNSYYSGADPNYGTYPCPTDGGLRLTKLHCNEVHYNSASSVLRGEFPGAYYCPQTGLVGSIVPRDTVPFGSRVVQACFAGSSSSTDVTTLSGSGRAFIDITGPWR